MKLSFESAEEVLKFVEEMGYELFKKEQLEDIKVQPQDAFSMILRDIEPVVSMISQRTTE